MFTIKRPKPGETEEDLLRQQEEFLQSQATPSAKLIRKPDKRHADPGIDHSQVAPVLTPQKDIVDLGGLPDQFGHTTTAPPVKKSKFKERAERNTGTEDQFERQDTHITKVLTEIVERDIKHIPVYYPDAPTINGFPTAPHRGTTEVPGGQKKRRSIFAQQFASGTAQQFGLKSKPAPRHASMLQDEMHRVTKPKGSAVVSGEGLNPTQAGEEAAQIHQENVSKIAAMSDAEILVEQRRLAETLDPSLLAFFKSKSKTNKAPSSMEKMDVDEQVGQSSSTMTQDSATMDVDRDVIDLSKAQPVHEKALPIKPAKKWVHMDNVEAEKLEWMKDLPPPPKADSTATGQPARFDFQGSPVAVDADVSTQIGLHHHGNEPERAGYSLEELFQLARSANMQQRVVALTTIARILQKARDGSLSEYVQTAIIPALLDGGLVHLLRWALDDSTDNTMVAAMLGLHALLVSPHDEDGLDRAFCWHQGASAPSLQPPPTPPPTEDEEEETDATVLKADVIKGLLRMQLLQRLRYILEVWRPPAPVVIQVLQVLTRISRHSAQSTYDVTQCPRLLDTIFKEFLPTTWTPVDDTTPMSNVHGFPVPEALKLIRVICAAGTNMAANIVSKYWLMTCISRYIVEDPSALQLPTSIGCRLQVETLRTWQVVTMYGLASHTFSDLYPVLMRGLQGLPTLRYASNPALRQWAEATVGLLEAVVVLAATSHKIATQQSAQLNSDCPEKVAPVVPDVHWSHVMGLYQPIELCLQGVLHEFSQVYLTQKLDLTFASCCLNFMATYINKIETQPGYNPVEWLERLEQLTSSCILPCITSPAFSRALHTAREHSVLLRPGKLARREASPSLPEAGALVSDAGDLCPLLEETSTLHFVLAAIRLFAAMGRTHKDLAPKLFAPVLQADDLVQYVRRCCQVKHTPAAANPFARYETFLQWHLLCMARITPDSCDAQLLHQMSLFMLPRIHQGDEHLAHDLLSTIVFNKDFFGDLVSAELSALSELELLQLSDQHVMAIGSATQQDTATSRDQLAADITRHLASMRASYLTCSAGIVSNLHRSRWQVLAMPQQTESFLLGPVGQLVAPVDWPFIPLVELYNNTSQLEESPSPQLVSIVTNSLRLIYALERWRPGVLDPIKFVTKLTRIMCTFLAGCDLFLDAGVHMYLEAIFKLYCRPVFLTRMDFTKRVPGLMSFYDFYIQFVMQFDAVSFGDSLFACYLLLPAQQRHDIQMRKALWTEHKTILRTLSVPISQVPIPLENFLHPDETNLELIRLYYQALYSGSVTAHWCPLLYLVAVHHVNRFVYLQESANRKLRLSMLGELSRCRYKNVEKDVLYYKKADPQAESAMEYYTELPGKRAAILHEAQTASVS